MDKRIPGVREISSTVRQSGAGVCGERAGTVPKALSRRRAGRLQVEFAVDAQPGHQSTSGFPRRSIWISWSDFPWCWRCLMDTI